MRKIEHDFEALYPGRKASFLKFPQACLTHPGFLACAILRVQECFFSAGWVKVSHFLRVVNNAATGADFLPGCKVGAGLVLHHPSGIVVGHGVSIGTNCTILQGVTLGENYKNAEGALGYPRVENDVILGAGAIILGPVSLGTGCRIGANSVVLQDIPAGRVAVGQPARVL